MDRGEGGAEPITVFERRTRQKYNRSMKIRRKDKKGVMSILGWWKQLPSVLFLLQKCVGRILPTIINTLDSHSWISLPWGDRERPFANESFSSLAIITDCLVHVFSELCAGLKVTTSKVGTGSEMRSRKIKWRNNIDWGSSCAALVAGLCCVWVFMSQVRVCSMVVILPYSDQGSFS